MGKQVVPGARCFLSARPLHITGPGLEKFPELGPGGLPTFLHSSNMNQAPSLFWERAAHKPVVCEPHPRMETGR